MVELPSLAGAGPTEDWPSNSFLANCHVQDLDAEIKVHLVCSLGAQVRFI